MKRGEVYWADLIPRSGSEQAGRRPVIIVSHDGFNLTRGWQSVNLIPITTSPSQADQETTVEIPSGLAGLRQTSFALCHQVTTLDKGKVASRIGAVPPEILKKIAAAIIVALDLD